MHAGWASLSSAPIYKNHATAPEFQLPARCFFTREIATIAVMGLSLEMDCRLAILRALIEAWEGVVDRNLSWFNQLVSNRCF